MKNSMTRTLKLAASLTLLAALSACSSANVDPTVTDPATPSNFSSSTKASPEKTGESAKSFIAGKDYRRDVSNPSHTTIVGEPVLEAEKRFVNAAVNKVKTTMSTEDILKAGYKICHFYSEEGTKDAVLDRITAESSNEEEGKIIMMSGAAVHTLCPEHADVS